VHATLLCAKNPFVGGNIIKSVDRLVAGIISAMQWLALPLIVLLFLQWPLRDIVRAYSREANDLGQIIFALYVAVSVTAATRAGTHLTADMLAHGYSPRVRRILKRIGAALGLLPWAFFIFYAGRTTVVSSVSQLESFADTYNPGYFIIKAALWIMAMLIAAQSLVDIIQPDRTNLIASEP
jgi:TRAP-type mannitol/chloroaromatic compound transport system permease small subunit